MLKVYAQTYAMALTQLLFVGEEGVVYAEAFEVQSSAEGDALGIQSGDVAHPQCKIFRCLELEAAGEVRRLVLHGGPFGGHE